MPFAVSQAFTVCASGPVLWIFKKEVTLSAIRLALFSMA